MAIYILDNGIKIENGARGTECKCGQMGQNMKASSQKIKPMGSVDLCLQMAMSM